MFDFGLAVDVHFFSGFQDYWLILSTAGSFGGPGERRLLNDLMMAYNSLERFLDCFHLWFIIPLLNEIILLLNEIILFLKEIMLPGLSSKRSLPSTWHSVLLSNKLLIWYHHIIWCQFQFENSLISLRRNKYCLPKNCYRMKRTKFWQQMFGSVW